MRTAIAFLVVTAALAPAASAATPHNPCYRTAGQHLRGEVYHLSAEAMARRTSHYMACGPYFNIPGNHTHWAQEQTPTCLHYFRVEGTSPGHNNSHTARWDYFGGDAALLIRWNGFGTWLHNQHDGNAVRFVPSLHNFNNHPWPTQIWMHCERTHLPPDD